MKKIIAAIVFGLLACTPVWAEDAKAPDLSKYPILEKLRGTNKELTYDYLGQRFGMDAWLLSGPNVMQVVYIPEGQKTALVGGALIGPDAEELGTGLLQDFMKAHPDRSQDILAKVRAPAIAKQAAADAAKNMTPSEKLWLDLQSVGQITYGDNDKAPVVYAIVDPVKPETKGVWGFLSLPAKQNDITLHVVPLALTTGDSIMTIAKVLGNPNPQQAWEEMLEGHDLGNEAPDPKGALGMKATVELAQRLNLRQLPLLVYRVPDGKGGWGPVKILRGMPKSWDGFLQEIGAFSDKIGASKGKTKP